MSRHLIDAENLQPTQQPALFQLQKREIAEQIKGLPTKWRLEVELYIYCKTTDKSMSGAMILNPLIDAVQSALAFDKITGTQTLGGLVSHCWINGTIDVYEGAQDTQTVAIVPIEIFIA